jgi:oxygen-dependent protoporphyrinogen oxidase
MLDKELKSTKGKLRGSLSADKGMQEITDKLASYLAQRNVVVHYSSRLDLTTLPIGFTDIVVATSIGAAEELVSLVAPKTTLLLRKIKTASLTSVAMKFSNAKSIAGFGCLFPQDQGFNSLGVLFNSDIFKNRGDYSETWILPSAGKTTEQIQSLILSDRKKLTSQSDLPEEIHVNHWPEALPLYNKYLEDVLSEEPFKSGLKSGVRLIEAENRTYLTGNYLGVIGLSKILDYNIRLANRIQKELS